MSIGGLKLIENRSPKGIVFGGCPLQNSGFWEPVLAWEQEARFSSKHLATMDRSCLNELKQF